MTVLFLSPSAGLGGAERVLLAMTAALRNERPDLPLHVLMLDDGPLSAELEALSVGVTRLPLPERLARFGDSQLAAATWTRRLGLCGEAVATVPGLCGFLGQFRDAVRRIQPALIHSNGIKTHLLTHGAQLGSVPLVWHVHDFCGTRPIARTLIAWSAQRLRAAIAISEAVAADFQAVVPRRPVVVIPNAIDTAKFRPRTVDADRLDRLAGMPPSASGTLRVGLVATYARWKGHDIFLKAAANVLSCPSDLPVRFYLVGGPVYQTRGSQFSQSELRSLVTTLGIDANVGVVGFQRDLSSIYPALDVLVHASTRPEPFGLTIVEAMACGTAVIASRSGGAAELFDHGRDALGVAPGDAPALANALRLLLGDVELRERLGRCARTTVTSRFDCARLGAQLLEVYRDSGLRLPSRHGRPVPSHLS